MTHRDDVRPVTYCTVEHGSLLTDLTLPDQPQIKQESRAIAQMAARCALCMGAMKKFESPSVRPRLLFPKFLRGFCSERSYEFAYKNLKFLALPIPEIIGGT